MLFGSTKSKIGNRKHCRKTGETQKEAIETSGKTCKNTWGNGRKQLGNQGNITLRELP